MNTDTISLRDQLAFGLADRLGKSLHVAGMTNQEMSECLEVSPNTVSNYINGNTRPRKLYLREWAMRTGVPLHWLETGHFPGETENPHSDNPDGGIVEPPVGLEPTTCALQGGKSARITPLFGRIAA